MAKVGDRFGHPSDNGVVRVMSVVNGWCMCRRPRCIPFVMSEKEVDARVATYCPTTEADNVGSREG